MASAFVLRSFVLVLALGCSREAITQVDGPAEGEATRAEEGTLPEVSTTDSANPEPQVKTMWVNHYQEPCMGWEGKYLCSLVAESENGPWRREYDPYVGLSLQWGHVYQVELELVEEGDHGPDAPAITTYVTEIRTDRAVSAASTTFDFDVDPQLVDFGYPSLSMTGADGGKLIDGTQFVCTSSQVCDQLEAALGGDRPFVVRFGYGAGLLPLVALSIDG